jgi:uncharacterized membrane protein YphA (DoxX/SURF4 family)
MEVAMNNDARVDRVWWALRLALGGTAFAAGADKFFNLLTDWDKYLSPVARRNSPVRPRNFMRLVGVIEMIAGATVLKGNTRLGGYVTAAWLLGIVANLISSGKYFDIAARDLNMAVAAYALGEITKVRDAAKLREFPADIQRVA